MKILYEEDEEILFSDYLNLLPWIMHAHIPNETYTPFHWVRKKNKRMWVSKWLPDHLILIQKKYSKLWRTIIVWIEMKRQKWWIISKEQILWLSALCEVNDVYTRVAKWFLEAKLIFQEFYKK